MARKRQVGLDREPAGAIGIRAGKRSEHPRERRGRHACCPDDRSRRDALGPAVGRPHSHAARVDIDDHAGQQRGDADPLQRALCPRRQRRREASEHPVRGLHEHDPPRARVGRAEVAAKAVACELRDLPSHLDSGRPCADHDEREPRAAKLRVGRHLRGLESAQDRRARDERALERLDLVGELTPRVVTEVRVVRATGDDQRVVGDARRRRHPCHRRQRHQAGRRIDRLPPRPSARERCERA